MQRIAFVLLIISVTIFLPADRAVCQTSPASAAGQDSKIALSVISSGPSETPAGRSVLLVIHSPDVAPGILKLWTSLCEGYMVVSASAQQSVWNTASPQGFLKQVDAFVGKQPVTHLVVLAGRDSGRMALELLDHSPQRLSGCVLVNLSPVVRTSTGIDMWAPRGAANRVPLWITASTHVKMVQPLLAWRRIAAVLPMDAPLTIDPQASSATEELTPLAGDTINRWLSDIAAGKKPLPGVDSQEVQLRKRFNPHVRSLLKHMQTTPSLTPATLASKTEDQLRLEVKVPTGWQRYPRGEKPYDKDARPYVQVYLTEKPGDRLFARAFATRADKQGRQGVLDAYELHLRRAGFLVVRHRRWSNNQRELEIASILWPSGDKWHQWLMLAAAQDRVRAGQPTEMVVVMDSSDKPDTARMAAAMKAILPSAKASISVASQPKSSKAKLQVER